MPDMSKPEYLTTDWIEELRENASELRREAFVKTKLAEQLDSLRSEFSSRIDEHEKWRDRRLAHEARDAAEATTDTQGDE